jgi:hypothetical protein
VTEAFAGGRPNGAGSCIAAADAIPSDVIDGQSSLDGSRMPALGF